MHCTNGLPSLRDQTPHYFHSYTFRFQLCGIRQASLLSDIYWYYLRLRNRAWSFANVPLASKFLDPPQIPQAPCKAHFLWLESS